MGPLTPELIGDTVNLALALILGMAFGFVLENAGFSSSRKLVGLFYGYDFTVLRVFFTAGITAMSGILILSYFGLLNPHMLYVNPTFLQAAIVGGLIMGAGFVIGGYCPGTSVCAAAVGKIDAMIFLLGTFFGVMIFAEGYPLFKGLYLAGNMGSPLISDMLGMSKGLFGFLLIAMALFAFIATYIVERKVNKEKFDLSPSKNVSAYLLTGLAFIIGIAVIFMPDTRTSALKKVVSPEGEKVIASIPIMTVDELTLRLIDRDPVLQVIDLRSPEEFALANIPSSVNIPADSLANGSYREILRRENKINIFYGDDQAIARKAAGLSLLLKDNERICYLEGGWSKFKSDVLEVMPSETTDKIDASLAFRLESKDKIMELIKEYSVSAKPVEQRKKVQGGC